jgi:hypothetical protein
MKEGKLYPIVEKHLKKYYGCFKTAKDTGLSYSRVDVVGIRDIGGELTGNIEIIVVEVKKGSQPFATASGQASSYKVYANRVYLADYRKKPFKQDEIQIASHLGIGLIQIVGKKCKEILTSPYYENMPKMAFEFLEKLRIGKCQFCGSFIQIGNEKDRYANVVWLAKPEKRKKCLARASKEKKGLMFWNYEIRKRKYKITRKKKYKYTTYERRFICPSCIKNFFSIKE